jgi:hypothetical protein
VVLLKYEKALENWKGEVLLLPFPVKVRKGLYL